MKTSEYLYGVNPKEWSELPYAKALREKIVFGKANLRKVAHAAKEFIHSDPVKYLQMVKHYNDIQKAIDFNVQLLFELEGDVDE